MYLAQLASRVFGRWPNRSAKAQRAIEAAVLIDDCHAARLLAAYPASVARQAAVIDAMNAPTLVNVPAVKVARLTWQDPATAIRNGVIVQAGRYVQGGEYISTPTADPQKTLPLTRRELMALIECDGGRPMHELDFAQVTGGAR